MKAKEVREAFKVMEMEQREEYLEHLRRCATPRVDALIAEHERRGAIYFPLRLNETIDLARRLERELAKKKA